MTGAPSADSSLDGHIDGLTQHELAVFARGDAEFSRHFAFADGLGPLFDATSCDSCHVGDGRAHPELRLTRFGRVRDDGSFDSMAAAGGPQLQARAQPDYPLEVLPADATGVTQLLAPAVTGLGLLEAVPDATLEALADPDDRDGDGISGRLQRIAIDDDLAALLVFDSGRPSTTAVDLGDATAIGRFGWKAGAISIAHQVVNAYHNDMGIATEHLSGTRAAGGPATAAAPEIGSDIVATVTTYIRVLRAPVQRDGGGQNVFESIGCSSCHVVSLTTGSSVIEALSNVTFAPFTDLLLHDMGPELDDGYTEGSATTSEWRTPALWGLGLAGRFQGGAPFYLHDGSATSLPDAIAFHGGEASGARDRFNGLTSNEQAALLEFLESL